MSSQFRGTMYAGLVVAVVSALAMAAHAEPASPDPWPDIADAAFHGRQLLDGTGLIALDMPGRAEDAAVVPVTLRATLPPGDPRHVKSFTLVIDENPSPVAARFDIGPNAQVSSISTRVRVNSYTNVHAVAELSDGKAYVIKTYVKASGGCSAPAAKNPDQARAEMGRMRFRQFAAAASPVSKLREAQLMVRHPNNSGLQMDQVTRLYVPAFFVHSLRIWQGDDLVLSMDGGISISEDPNLRFTYAPNGAKAFRAEAVDTDNHVYKGEWPVDASAM